MKLVRGGQVMPYISQVNRQELQSRYARTPGELNYQITKLLAKYIRTNGLSYQRINEVVGALDGASKEFYRRVAEPYEDLKMRQHGDVYVNSDPSRPETL